MSILRSRVMVISTLFTSFSAHMLPFQGEAVFPGILNPLKKYIIRVKFFLFQSITFTNMCVSMFLSVSFDN